MAEKAANAAGGGRGTARKAAAVSPAVARLMLLACAGLWGGSYLLAKFAIAAIPPMWLMGVRLLGACLCMLALFPRHVLGELRGRDASGRPRVARIAAPGLLVGLTYFGTMATQTVGLQWIDPGRSAFLTAGYCVLTPFAGWLVLRRKPAAHHLVAALLCLAGVGFVSMSGGGSGHSRSGRGTG